MPQHIVDIKGSQINKNYYNKFRKLFVWTTSVLLPFNFFFVEFDPSNFNNL